ncbi:MAG TPA: riboflavin synthase, partial [Planctomycetota bacterium]|nr:riboflavin synthase [Planctomycetota bacterium]
PRPLFTGIVEGARPIRSLRRRGGGVELSLDLGALGRGVRAGDSIALAGVCLTVEALRGRVARFFLSGETLRVTRFGGLRIGAGVNVERSLRLGERLGGHLVYGHVDGLGRVRALVRDGEGAVLRVEVPAPLARYLVPKGSIAVDGVSLTLARVRGRSFDAALVPETLRRTTLSLLRPGDAVHLEGDAIGKWVEALRGPRRGTPRRSQSARPRGRPRSGA